MDSIDGYRRRTRAWAALATLALAAAALAAAALAAATDEQAGVMQWRAQRIAALTSDTGWLSLVGLLWLKDGDNSFGRSPGNALVLDNPALAGSAGTFVVKDHAVRFLAAAGAGITHHGEPVTSLDLTTDAAGEPTVLSSGSLRFFVIERAGKLGVRIRDVDSPRRRAFQGLEYFPISDAWNITARYEPYVPVRHIPIVNILGMQEQAVSPGAIVFTRDGQEWRLDAVLESPQDTQLFIMFADATSGHETYGGGRFMYIPLPEGNTAVVDFNKAYNPPCALNDFATCPLPPYQNRLKLRVDAGELTYRGAPGHSS